MNFELLMVSLALFKLTTKPTYPRGQFYAQMGHRIALGATSMQPNLKPQPKFIKHLKSINLNINHLYTINDSFAIANYSISERGNFDERLFTYLFNSVLFSGDISLECAKAVNLSLQSLFCEIQLISKWIRLETLAAEIVKETIQTISEKGYDHVDMDKFSNQIQDCRTQQTELLVNCEIPNLDVPQNSDYYFLELHKAGFQNGYRSGWSEIVDEIIQSNPSPKGQINIDKIFEIFSFEVENFVLTATGARVKTYSFISQLNLLVKT